MASLPRLEVLCAICNQPVTFHADTCTDENGYAVHVECYVKRVTAKKSAASPTPAKE
ncbi:MAG: hypothetical protein WBW53_21680 [Terriglobales bacterium]